MADKHVTMEVVAQEPRAATSRHATLVMGFRAKLSERTSPLDRVAPEQLEQARKEFREFPEVAGEPLAARERDSAP